jgi:hypothetical protein
MSRSRTPFLFVLVATLALLAAACKQPDNTPQGYNDTTATNFVHGCTGEGSGTSLGSKSACECAYTWVTEHVPESKTDLETHPDKYPNYQTDGPTFISINNKLKTDPNSLPDEVKQGIAQACASQGWKVEGGSSTGTAPLAPTGTSTPG